jgi:hypothetical protein
LGHWFVIDWSLVEIIEVVIVWSRVWNIGVVMAGEASTYWSDAVGIAPAGHDIRKMMIIQT